MALALSLSMGTPNRVGFPLRSQPAERGSEDLLSQGRAVPTSARGQLGSGVTSFGSMFVMGTAADGFVPTSAGTAGRPGSVQHVSQGVFLLAGAHPISLAASIWRTRLRGPPIPRTAVPAPQLTTKDGVRESRGALGVFGLFPRASFFSPQRIRFALQPEPRLN